MSLFLQVDIAGNWLLSKHNTQSVHSDIDITDIEDQVLKVLTAAARKCFFTTCSLTFRAKREAHLLSVYVCVRVCLFQSVFEWGCLCVGEDGESTSK